jgi:hypothetical protein
LEKEKKVQVGEALRVSSIHTSIQQTIIQCVSINQSINHCDSFVHIDEEVRSIHSWMRKKCIPFVHKDGRKIASHSFIDEEERRSIRS